MPLCPTKTSSDHENVPTVLATGYHLSMSTSQLHLFDILCKPKNQNWWFFDFEIYSKT